jgi:replicative DNA helicase
MNTENKTERQPNFKSLSTVWLDRVVEIKTRTENPQYPFGIKDLDKITHGITRGKVTLIAARTSEAKSSFSIQTAFGIAETGKPVAYITLEDDAGQIAERIFSNMFEIDNQDLITGKVDPLRLEDPKIQEIFKAIKFLPIENYGHNFEEIKYIIETIQPKPEIVFLDYVQMVEQLPRESEYDALSRFAQKCKRFAEENNIGLVIVSQINRAGAKEGRPQLHHLQGCGKLEQVSDLALLLYCPFNYQDSSYDYSKDKGRGMEECPRDYYEINVAKNKNGIKNWTVPVRFTGKFYKFYPWNIIVQKLYPEKDWRTK